VERARQTADRNRQVSANVSDLAPGVSSTIRDF